MKRSTRISFLVFTVCAAVLAFGALWYTRPSSPSYIIEESKQRQEVPLLEVKEPASRLAPPVINYDKLAAAVSPQVKTALINDDDFISGMVASNKEEISKAVKEYTTSTLVPSMNSKISSLVEELAISLNTDLKSDLTSMVDDKIQTTLDSIDINTYLPQLVDLLTPIVVEQVYNMVEANKENFIQVTQEVSPALTGDDARQLYLDYREQVINDLVPIILDKVESSITLAAPSAAVMDDSKPNLEAEDSETVDSVVVKAVVPATNDSQPQEASADATVKDDDTSAGVSATIVAQVLDSNATNNTNVETGEDEISIPYFYQTPTKTLTQEEYLSQREEIRKQAISDALSKLSDQ